MKKKIIIFYIVEVEGEIRSTNNKKALEVYKKESSKYYKKQTELFNLAYTKKKKSDDLFDFFNNTNEKPKFNVKIKMKSLGYELIIDYKKPAYFVLKTPFAILKKYKMKEKMNFITSDGEIIANVKIEIFLKKGRIYGF
ncbi:MAG: hypothetical protein WCT85_03855 [Parachlamydiales bacterium]|jgi:hypothetical protein